MYTGDFQLYQKMFSNLPLPTAHSPLPFSYITNPSGKIDPFFTTTIPSLIVYNE
jgi:hypothetical protein